MFNSKIFKYKSNKCIVSNNDNNIKTEPPIIIEDKPNEINEIKIEVNKDIVKPKRKYTKKIKPT